MTRSRFLANRVRWWRAACLAAISALVLLVVAGCEETQSPVESGSSVVPVLQGDGLTEFSTEGVLTFLQLPDLSSPRSTRKFIYAARGGTVALGDVRVFIPPKALTRNTTITIELPKDPARAIYDVAAFGPDGLRFSRPVTITLPLQGVDLTGIDPSTLTVSFWNGSAWIDHPSTVTSTSIKAPTTHFSTYGARRSGGIDTVSGG